MYYSLPSLGQSVGDDSSKVFNTLLHQGGLRALILLTHSAHIAVITVVIYVIFHKIAFVGVVCVVVLVYVCAFVCVRK